MGTFSCTIQEVTGVASWGTRLRLAAHGLKIRALRAASSQSRLLLSPMATRASVRPRQRNPPLEPNYLSSWCANNIPSSQYVFICNYPFYR